METDEFPDPKAGMRRGVYEVEDGDALERDDDEGEDGGGDADETEQLRMARCGGAGRGWGCVRPRCGRGWAMRLRRTVTVAFL